MIQKFRDFARWSKPYTDRYGTMSGVRLALEIRRASWVNSRGTVTSLHVPELAYPIAVRSRSSDLKVVDQIFLERQAHFPVAGAPRAIIDAGANIGLSSVVLATRFPEAHIVALEINRSNYELLVANTSRYPNIEPRLCGLWSEVANLQILNPDAEEWAFRADRTDAGSEGEDHIPAVGVADLLEEFGDGDIDLLKIDVEGSEIEIFESGAETWLRRVRQLAIECHDRIRPGCSKAVITAAAAHQFSISNWGEYLLMSRLADACGRR